jgi:hypothetical protein
VILAISSTKTLKGARVLPKVWLVKEFRILNVLTLDEPVSYRIDAGNIDPTLAFEVPIEIMSGAPAIVTYGNPVLEASPWILRWEHPKEHSPERAEGPVKDASHGGDHGRTLTSPGSGT